MSDTRARAAPAADDARIRLEGALEEVEAATGQYRRAKSLLGRRFRTTVGAHRAFFEQLRAAEAANDAAAEKVAELGRREEWTQDFAPRRAVDAYHRARAELAARVDELFGAPHTGMVARLDALLAEAMEPLGPVLLTIPLALRHTEALMIAVIGLFFVLLLAGFISTPIGGQCVLTLLFFSALSTLPWLLSGGRVEVFADRIRLRTHTLSREVPLGRQLVFAPVAAQTKARALVPQSDVSVTGLPWFRLSSVSDAALLDGVVRVLRSPRFEPPRRVSASPVVLSASWVNPVGQNESGVLALLEERAWFIADGAATYAAIDPHLQLESAGPLAYALASVGPERSELLLRQLIANNRVRAIDAAAVSRATLFDTRLEVPGTPVQATFPKTARQAIADWQWRVLGAPR